MRIFVATAVLALMSSSVSAEYRTGNDLYEICKSTGPGERIACANYLIGINDTIEKIRSEHLPFTSDPKDTRYFYQYSFCVVPGVTGSQLADVAKNYLEKHPETRHYAAAGLAYLALQEAFPCP